MAITLGLGVSLLVSLTLLPTGYHLLYRRIGHSRLDRFIAHLSLDRIGDAYEAGFDRIMRHRRWAIPIFLFLIILAAVLWYRLPMERFPALSQRDTLLEINWNEDLHVDENRRRVNALLAPATNLIDQEVSRIGTQQFVLNEGRELQPSEALIYLQSHDPAALRRLQSLLREALDRNFPGARYAFKAPPTLFERLFGDEAPMLVAEVSPRSGAAWPVEQATELILQLNRELNLALPPPATREYLAALLRPEQMALYELSYEDLIRQLKAALSVYEVDVIRAQQQVLPIVISRQPGPIHEIIASTPVRNARGEAIPLSSLLSLQPRLDYQHLNANRSGPYVPLAIEIPTEKVALVQARLRRRLQAQGLEVSFSGRYFRNRGLVRELVLVLGMSLLLLYFIMAAQFESLLQPLIVLLEVPLDIAGALLLLYLFGASINLMSMIGIIVMTGIIINDSILKIDTINRLRREGIGLEAAIRQGGTRRLKPILMTSLTTILAATPFFLSSGLGSELQRPLALALIGGMALGTIVSLYGIPLLYQLLYRRDQKTT